MYLLILGVIYLIFIGLGATDTQFGPAWPTIQMEMEVPLSYAGIVTMLVAGGTVTATLLTARLIKKFGAGKVTLCGVLMSAMALLGISFVSNFWMLCLLVIPLGFAGGTIDATLNNHVALHYSSRHMSWLHCFWGLGGVLGPIIMGQALTSGAGWNSSYRVVFFMQISFAILLMLSLPLWKRQSMDVPAEISEAPTLKLSEIIRVPGVKYVLLGFFAYCAVESTTSLWASTYLVRHRGVLPETAASYASLIFIGITVGRFLSGIIANKVGDKNMVRGGIILALIGIVAVWLPIPSNVLALNGLVVIGLGCAPIFPALIHATPFNFGKEKAPSIIGVQMASAYIGITFMPPLFGLIAEHINISLYPVFLFILAVIMLVMLEGLNKVVARNRVN